METQKALSLIEKSEHIGIILPAEPTQDVFTAAEVLLRMLTGLNKHVGLLTPLPRTEGSAPSPFTALEKSKPLPKEFIVALDTATSPASQVRYEKNANEISFIVSPLNTSITKESISFREGKVQCDTVCAIGVPDIEAVATDYIGPDFFTQMPIIAIDTSPEYTNYGEVHLVDPKKASCSEIVYEFLSLLTETALDQQNATLLLSGITFCTRAFADPKTTADTLLAASELVRLGASLADAQTIGANTFPLRLQQLHGRAIVRSRMDEHIGVMWSFLTAEDFEKTGSTAKDTEAVLRHIETVLPQTRIAALIWQETALSKIKATLAGARPLLEALTHSGDGSFQSPSLVLTSTFETFREAEESVRSLLTPILNSI